MVLLKQQESKITEQGTEKLYDGTRTFFEFPTETSPAKFIHDAFEDSESISDYDISQIDDGYYMVVVKVCPPDEALPSSIQLEVWEDGFMLYRSNSVFPPAIGEVLDEIREQTEFPTQNSN